MRASPFTAPVPRPDERYLPPAKMAEIVLDFAERHSEAQRRCLVVGGSEVRALTHARAIGQSQPLAYSPGSGMPLQPLVLLPSSQPLAYFSCQIGARLR